MKTLHATASTGSPIELCPKCHEVKEEIAAFFKVPLSPGNAENAQQETIDVLFRPMYYCQCERRAAELFEGAMVHYVSSTGKHEASVVIEIFDAITGRVKLRNLCNLTIDVATYGDIAKWDSWHWIKKDCQMRTQNETQEEGKG